MPQIPPTARVIASTVLLGLALLAFKWCTPVPQSGVSLYPFTLPATFLTCLQYTIHSNEVFSGWEIHQPMLVVADGGVSNITISNNYFHINGWCEMAGGAK